MDQPVPTIAVEPPKFNWLLFSVIGIAILIVGIVAGLLIGKYIYTPKPAPSPQAKPDLAPPDTANWKTYTNISDGYSLKYPDDWIIQTLTDVKDKFYPFDALGKEMTLSKTILGKNGYQMIIFRNFSGPISEEPQICVYPDSQIDSGTYAPLRFTSDIVTEIRDGGYRRSVLNEYPDQIRFEVCKPRENPSAGGIVFVPVYITYLTPKKYDFRTLNEMDQILSTFKFVDQANSVDMSNWKTYTGNGFIFKYPSILTDLKDQGGVSGPWTGNPQSIINLGDNTTIHWGTDAPYDGFSVYIVSKLKSVSLLDYLHKEVETAKNSPRGIKSGTITEISLGGQAAAFIDNEVAHREYFVSSPDGKRIVVFSRINSTDSFLNTFDQILSTFKFTN